MFNVGDYIVYPMHGAGTIDAIEEKDILGQKQAYYIIKMPGEVKVMIPTSQADKVGIRGIIDKTRSWQGFWHFEWGWNTNRYELEQEIQRKYGQNENRRYFWSSWCC